MSLVFQTDAFQNNAFEAVAGGGDAFAIPSAVSGTGALGSYVGKGNGDAAPELDFGTGSVTDPVSASGNGTISVTSVSGTGSLGSYSASGGTVVNGTATPSAVTGTGSVSASASGGGTASPSAVIGTGAVQATAKGNGTGSPTAVSGTGSVASSAKGDGTTASNFVAGTGTLGDYSAQGGGSGDAFAIPESVNGIGSIGDVTANGTSAPTVNPNLWGRKTVGQMFEEQRRKKQEPKVEIVEPTKIDAVANITPLSGIGTTRGSAYGTVKIKGKANIVPVTGNAIVQLVTNANGGGCAIPEPISAQSSIGSVKASKVDNPTLDELMLILELIS